MFFNRDHFIGLVDDDIADSVAKLANQIIDDNAKVVYGNLFEDGTIENLSTEKNKFATHVALAIGLFEMGVFRSSKKIHIDKTEADEIAEASAILARQLRVENNNIRGVKE